MVQSLFSRIAHPTDLSEGSVFAFFHALRLAVAASSKLDILHVDEMPHAMGWAEFPTASETLRSWGLEPGSLGSNGDLDHIRRIDAYGKEPVHPILGYIDESMPDLMVLATHRRSGLDRWLHKEIASKLARSRAISTLFVPFGDEGFVSPSTGKLSLRRMLLPVDWLPSAQAAVDTAAAAAGVLGCEELEIVILHIGKEDDFPAADLPEKPGWRWVRKSRSGGVVEEILTEAESLETDLIVMVTQGHDGFLDALRGSTTERVLQSARCPLLAVPAV